MQRPVARSFGRGLTVEVAFRVHTYVRMASAWSTYCRARTSRQPGDPLLDCGAQAAESELKTIRARQQFTGRLVLAAPHCRAAYRKASCHTRARPVHRRGTLCSRRQVERIRT